MYFEEYQSVQNNTFKSIDTKFNILYSLLTNIYTCYEHMKKDYSSIPNNEEEIRDILLIKYMKEKAIKKPICSISGFRFEREVPEDHTVEKGDKTITGRVDIKVLPTTGLDNDNDEAYFTIECKRLDDKATKGISGLNAEYIKNGIVRFIDKQYKSYYTVNAMIGFIVSDIDVDLNVRDINYVNSRYYNSISNTIQKVDPIEKDKIYHSIHKTKEEEEISLLHLMMDFSSNIR